MVLSEEQVLALESQAAHLNGKALVDFVQEKVELLDAGEMPQSIIDRAMAAQDQIEAAEQVAKEQAKAQKAIAGAKKAEEKTWTLEESCKNAAGIIYDRGFTEAADALLVDLESADGLTLRRVKRTLHSFVRTAGFSGWIRKTADVFGHKAEEYANATADFSAEKVFPRFVEALDRVRTNCEQAQCVSKGERKKLVVLAESSLEYAKATRFDSWLCEALLRLMSDKYSAIAALLAQNTDLSELVVKTPAYKKISVLTTEMKNRAQQQIDAIRPVAGSTKKETSAKKIERSERDKELRNALKGHNPPAPKHGAGKKSKKKRQQSDPNRSGK